MNDLKLTKIADEVWIATALLHREQPARLGFEGSEILHKVGELHPRAQTRPGVNPHIYLHCVANKKPNSARYRMLYRNPDGTLRLYRPGDDCHPERRKGKTVPETEAIPPPYRELLEWYSREYSARAPEPAGQDPILALRGVGKEVWRELGGEAFIAQLRSDWLGNTGQAGDQPRQAPRKQMVR
jgi:hypothetical protein